MIKKLEVQRQQAFVNYVKDATKLIDFLKSFFVIYL